jgi:hypothetical protein
LLEPRSKALASDWQILGYSHFLIDDCWAVGRDARGELVADDTLFPGGIPALVASIHAKGLKFGIYTDRGAKTCAGCVAPAAYMKFLLVLLFLLAHLFLSEHNE